MYYPSSSAVPSRAGKKNLEHLLFAWRNCVVVPVPALIQTSRLAVCVRKQTKKPDTLVVLPPKMCS